uniref:NADH-ubiquinone oxidoreductase chain 3 n=1 Tax=Leipothrix sp. 1 XFX-2017 TaxID=1955440 RepID=A0A1S5XVY4_9ACAR|nr:NADH dehydrogenase subunit 3 [Leipothrix sp. 1 XFX-2017]
MCLLVLIFLLSVMFFLASSKMKMNFNSQTPFECGFSSYFYSRHSFSIHYFIITLIFLFLDLEICFLFPFFMEDLGSVSLASVTYVFVSVLLLGLLKEWQEMKLDWVF